MMPVPPIQVSSKPNDAPHILSAELEKASEQAWAAYVHSAKKAHETMRFEDGIAAGKAWARFLSCFVGDRRGEPT